MRPEGLGALPARSSGLRCQAEAAAEALPPEVPLLAGIKNWRHAEDLDPAGDPGGAPGGPWLERFERLRERSRDGAGPTAGVQSP
ncbi:hypothetical protein NDU88_010855 [Pleurodeles waltl]|uniref:Uncharacterized protein n=1 Tax=Pleurodeles waltl TaxID=8319 RepID=A0AAV7PW30_PLEWA|nr:hypothetical protein NDU88_010855 [Pleurodeles waltl]